MSTVATRPATVTVTTGLYDRADQQHLTASTRLRPCWPGIPAWISRPPGRPTVSVQLVIKGHVIAHQFPEMAVAVLCRQPGGRHQSREAPLRGRPVSNLLQWPS